ncbi:MAG: M24 family metallopeptidase [Desulfovibrio sp.]
MTHSPLTIPTHVYEERREKLRAIMREEAIPAMLVSSAANRYYLSGFELHNSQCNETSGWLLITESKGDWLLTDPRFEDAAGRLWDKDKVFIYSGKKYEQLKKLLQTLELTNVAFDPDAISVHELDGLNKAAAFYPESGHVEQLRVIKDSYEIKLMEASCKLNHQVMQDIEPMLQVGRTEAEISWEIEKLFREGGATEMAFPSIVGVNKNAALPHAIPGSDIITENSLVLIDTGGRLGDYCSDQTRTFWVGNTVSDRFEEVKAQVQAAQQAAIDILKPEMTIADAYHAANMYFLEHNVAEYFTHSLGHGIGLETHEAPSVGPRSFTKLKTGMVITVEPGLYYSDWGGIRWEYELLITEDGARIL